MSIDTRPPRTDDLLAYAGPVAYEADGIKIDQFVVEATSIENMRLAFQGRSCAPGTYTRLTIDGALWMSDTSAEKRDHWSPVSAMRQLEGDVLIHGLGLGLVVAAAIRLGHSVDVVEQDQRVIDAVGPSMEALAAEHGVECRIHHGDAYTYQFPKGQTWAVAWHDIWLDLCVDNLDEMAKLHRRYGRRVEWQGSWGRELLRRERDRGRRSGWGW